MSLIPGHNTRARHWYLNHFRFKGIFAFFSTLLLSNDHHGLHHWIGVEVSVLLSVYDTPCAQTLSHRNLLRVSGFIHIYPVMSRFQISHKSGSRRNNIVIDQLVKLLKLSLSFKTNVVSQP